MFTHISFGYGYRRGDRKELANHPDASTEHSKRGELTKRVTCNKKPGTEAPVAGAVACINYLASLGQQSCDCQSYIQFCALGGAQLTGQSGVNHVTVPW